MIYSRSWNVYYGSKLHLRTAAARSNIAYHYNIHNFALRLLNFALRIASSGIVHQSVSSEQGNISGKVRTIGFIQRVRRHGNDM